MYQKKGHIQIFDWQTQPITHPIHATYQYAEHAVSMFAAISEVSEIGEKSALRL